MDILIACVLVFGATLVANLPLLRFPLTEDEGNHYYLAQFYDRGTRMHTSYSALGYFEISWLACCVARLYGQHTPKLYQALKVAIHATGSASICLLACILTGSVLSGLLAGLMFTMVTAARSAKFWATYGEHAQIIPMTLGLAGAFYAVHGQGAGWSLFAGVCMGLCIHLKPTGLLFAGAIPLYLLLAPSPLWTVAGYLLAVAAVLGLPFFVLRQQPPLWAAYGYRNAWQQYYKLCLTEIIATGLKQVRNLLRLALYQAPLRTTTGYSDTLLAKAHDNRMNLLQITLFPALRDLWLPVFCALLQLVWGAIHCDPVTALLAFYLLCMFLTQHIQQNYYTPHFNIIWPPVCILAAMFMTSLLHSGVNTPGVWLLGGLAAVFLGQRAYEAWTLRHDHVPWVRYLEAASIGKALHPRVQRTDVLLAMGTYPSINIYADCPGIPTHLSGCMDGTICHKDILVRRLQEHPPQWIAFYTPQSTCPWDIRRIMELGGQVYTPCPIEIDPADAAELARFGSTLRQFMAYRLHDRLCAVNQCELGRQALALGDPLRARALFTAAAAILPEEMRLRLEMLPMTPEAARDHLRRAQLQTPAAAAFLLAEAAVACGERELARTHLADLLAQEAQPYADDPRLYVLRALSCEDTPDTAGTRLDLLAHALQVHPFHVPTLWLAIALLDAAGQLPRATSLIHSLALLCPEDPQAARWKAALASATPSRT